MCCNSTQQGRKCCTLEVSDQHKQGCCADLKTSQSSQVRGVIQLIVLVKVLVLPGNWTSRRSESNRHLSRF